MPPDETRAITIPRLHKLDYLRVGLREVAQGASFERVRQALLRHATETGEEQMIPGVVSRLRDEYTFWSPTQETLYELMLLGFVQQVPLPSARQHVDAHRANTYELTAKGRVAFEQLRGPTPEDNAKFLDLLALSLAEAHPGFRSLLVAAHEHPLCIPEYSVGEMSRLIEQGGAARLAEDAIVRMTAHWPWGAIRPTARSLTQAVNDAMRRRFPPTRPRPTQKDVLDTVDDAVLAFASRARGVPLDAISFNVCMAWASQLAVLEESRYVEGWSGRTVWATARVEEFAIRRHGFDAMPAVVDGLRDGFRQVTEGMSDARAAGFVPIYRVRAQAAFAARVNVRLVDMAIRQILSGQIAAPFQVQVALGRGTPPPRSEPVFTYENRRFFDVMIINKEGEQK